MLFHQCGIKNKSRQILNGSFCSLCLHACVFCTVWCSVFFSSVIASPSAEDTPSPSAFARTEVHCMCEQQNSCTLSLWILSHQDSGLGTSLTNWGKKYFRHGVPQGSVLVPFLRLPYLMLLRHLCLCCTVLEVYGKSALENSNIHI